MVFTKTMASNGWNFKCKQDNIEILIQIDNETPGCETLLKIIDSSNAEETVFYIGEYVNRVLINASKGSNDHFTGDPKAMPIELYGEILESVGKKIREGVSQFPELKGFIPEETYAPSPKQTRPHPVNPSKVYEVEPGVSFTWDG